MFYITKLMHFYGFLNHRNRNVYVNAFDNNLNCAPNLSKLSETTCKSQFHIIGVFYRYGQVSKEYCKLILIPYSTCISNSLKKNTCVSLICNRTAKTSKKSIYR